MISIKNLHEIIPQSFLNRAPNLNIQNRDACYWSNMKRSTPIDVTLDTAVKYIGDSNIITDIERIDSKIRGIEIDIPIYICKRKKSIYLNRDDVNISRSIEDYTNTHSVGKGPTIEQAKASCLCEAIERYCASSWSTAQTICVDYESVKEYAIRPTDIDSCSEKDLELFIAHNKEEPIIDSFIKKRKFRLFKNTLPIDWTWGFSLVQNHPVLIPAASAFLSYKPSDNSFTCNQAGTNGLALGNNYEEAILQGFFELLERDAIMIFMRTPIKIPDVDISTFQGNFIQNVIEKCEKARLDLIVKDFTTDLGIPTFCAQIFDEFEHPEYFYGFGCHLDPEIALSRAITEVFQGRSSYLYTLSKFNGKIEKVKMGPIHSGLLKNTDTSLQKKYSDFSNLSSDNLKNDIEVCLNILKKEYMDMIVVDLSMDGIDFKVVKMIVPGLTTCDQKAPPVFLSNRIFNIPVKMRYLDKPLKRDDLYLGWLSI